MVHHYQIDQIDQGATPVFCELFFITPECGSGRILGLGPHRQAMSEHESSASLVRTRRCSGSIKPIKPLLFSLVLDNVGYIYTVYIYIYIHIIRLHMFFVHAHLHMETCGWTCVYCTYACNVYLSICLFVCLSTYPSIHLSMYPPICLCA